MGVMAESSGGTPPRGSGSTEACPGMRSTRENSLWSHRKGSLVSSLPGRGVVRGKPVVDRENREEMCVFTHKVIMFNAKLLLVYSVSPERLVHRIVS